MMRDTLAIIGILASIVNMKGVIEVDRMRDAIENPLRVRTTFRSGASYTTLMVSRAAIGVFEDITLRGVRYPLVMGSSPAGVASVVQPFSVEAAVVDVAGLEGLNGGLPVGCSWGLSPSLLEVVSVGSGGGTGEAV